VPGYQLPDPRRPGYGAGVVSPAPWFSADDGTFTLYHGDSLDLLTRLGGVKANLIFADPPYFLSNDGITCQSGQMVSVNKGSWDRLTSVTDMHAFNTAWLERCRERMHPDGSIWVSGTRHVIYSVGFAMQQIGLKLLNEITWEKPNPPPNLSCRYFTHSTETLLWAATSYRSRHTFNYDEMRRANGGRQMKAVWTMTAPGSAEKAEGRHPTQKPLALLERIVIASSRPGDVVVDPFNGSGTTGLAALRLGRRYIGIDSNLEFLELTRRRWAAARADPTHG
jgi:site-specific DNA-methyltransferase (adenine-specific)